MSGSLTQEGVSKLKTTGGPSNLDDTGNFRFWPLFPAVT